MPYFSSHSNRKHARRVFFQCRYQKDNGTIYTMYTMQLAGKPGFSSRFTSFFTLLTDMITRLPKAVSSSRVKSQGVNKVVKRLEEPCFPANNATYVSTVQINAMRVATNVPSALLLPYFLSHKQLAITQFIHILSISTRFIHSISGCEL